MGIQQGSVNTGEGGIISGTVTSVPIGYTSKWQAYVVATTSAAAGIIIKTSGAHTLYVTDIIVSATTPNNVQLCSETTVLAQAYLAAQGGFAFNARTPIVCTSAQSFVVVLASSGSVAVFAAGFTAT
jgi:hypothetical protein